MKKLDLLVVSPSAAQKLYQDLSYNYSAIEPNIWAGLLCNSARSKDYSVRMLDIGAERLSIEEASKEIKYLNPRVLLIVATGQNPNDSSASMQGVVDLADELKKIDFKSKITVVGPHVNALPYESIEIKSLDIIFCNEGVYALNNLLSSDLSDLSLSKIKGIGYKDTNNISYINEPEQIVPHERLEYDLPGIALDLYPDFKKYRTSTWHTNYNEEIISPFASIYTSLNCPYQCEFCLINIIARTDNNKNISARDSNIFRYWSPEFTIKQLEKISELGVKNLKIADEMYVLKPAHFLRLSELIIERKLDFNIWCYARINTIKEKYLKTLKNAGVNWIGLGIESGDTSIRQEITKGHFKDVDIRDIVKLTQSYDINITGNFIFGLGHDNYETMQKTYNLSVELNTENMNAYAAMCLPGSPLYLQAKNDGKKLPDTFAGYGFLSYDCQPNSTEYLTAAEVLKFRDNHVEKYFKRPEYLSMIENKFGKNAVDSINKLYSIKLKRKILGD